MEFEATSIPGAFIINPKVFRDERGFFLETYRRDRYSAHGLSVEFVQDNHSSSRRGTLRGLHSQRRFPQGKLIRVIEGEIMDVAVDLRSASPGFKKVVCVKLSAETHNQFYVPPGCFHGFYVLSPHAQVEYKCTDVYHPEDELTLQWNEPELSIPWPLKDPILSEKDKKGLPLAQVLELLRS